MALPPFKNSGPDTGGERLLYGKRILVTGAESLGGGVLVAALAEAGADLVVQHRKAAAHLTRGLDLARNADCRLRVFAGDVTDEDGSAVERLVAVAAHAFGGLDAGVILAGAATGGAADQMDAAVDDFTTPCRAARAVAGAIGGGQLSGGQQAGLVLVLDAVRADAAEVTRSVARRSVLEAVCGGLWREFSGHGVRITGLASAPGLAVEDRAVAALTLLSRDDDLLDGHVFTPDRGTAAAEQRRRLAAWSNGKARSKATGG
jgi:NAD(P)-dependent dehydrogenase (short-subunit alcohol dehydrogenase family)